MSSEYIIDYKCGKCRQPAFGGAAQPEEIGTTIIAVQCDRCGNTTWTVTAVEEVRAQ